MPRRPRKRNDVPIYSKWLNEMNKEKLVAIEVGVWWGVTSALLLDAHPNMTLYGIDPYMPYRGFWRQKAGNRYWNETYLKVVDSLAPLGDRMVLIRNTSEDAVDKVPNEVDFLLIDGNHDYDFVKKDMELYVPKVRVDGIVVMHDYLNKKTPGVKQAVDEYVVKNGIQLEIIPYPQIVYWHACTLSEKT